MKSVFQFVCKVCGESLSDGWEHTLERKKTNVGLVPIDEAHSKALDKFRENNFNGNCPICDGYVRKSCYGDGNSWEIACDECGFLFDED
jgi:hypothetical protein|tara:strand:- start:1083 stop:1349 length:267 start_codon:yes stop_codon:yes gene_type:complete